MISFDDYLIESSQNYRTGDHVYMRKPGTPSGLHLGGHNPENYDHGVVHSHTHLVAKVKWENGKESTHRQGDGDLRAGGNSSYEYSIKHSKSDLNSPGAIKVTNDQHKAMLSREHERQMSDHEEKKKAGLR